MSRRLRLFLLAAGVAAAGAGLWLALPSAAEHLIASQLAARGLAPATVSVTRVGLSGAHLARLEAAEGALVLRDVDVRWSLSGGLDTLRIGNAAVSGRWSTENGLDLGPLGALLEGGEGTADAPPTLPAERITVDAATLTLALPQGDLVATASGTATQAEPGPTLDITAAVTAPGLSGRLSFTGSAVDTGGVPVAGDGHVSLSAQNFAAPGIAEAVSGSVGGDLTIGADAVTFAADAPVDVTAQGLAPALREALAAALPTPPQDITLSLASAEPGQPPVLQVSGLSDPGGLVISSDRLTMQATAADALARIAASGSIRLRDGVPLGSLRDISGRVAGVTLQGAPVDALFDQGSLTVSAEGLAAEARITATAEGLSLDSGGIGTAHFEGGLRLTGQPSMTGTLHATGASLTLDGLRLADGVTATEPVRLVLKDSEGPLLRLQRDEDGAMGALLAATLDVPALPLATPAGPVAVAFADMAVTGAFVPGKPPVLGITAKDGSVTGGGAHLRDVSLKVDVADGAPTVALAGHMDALPGEPPDLATARLHPYGVSLTAEPREGALSFSADVRTAEKELLASARGSLDLSDGSGEARVRVPRQDFTPGGIQPDDLHALLGTYMHGVSGTVLVDGTIRWNSQGLRPNMKLLLQDLSFTQGFVTLTRVNGVIALTSFDPIRTPKGQEVSVAAIDAGLPLLDAVAAFEIADGTLLLDSASATLAQGTIRARPTAIPLSLDNGEVTLDVQDMRLGPLVDLAAIEGLQAKGRLAGTVPLRFAGGDVIITNATLSSMRPDRVAYAPKEAPSALSGGGQSVDLVLQAMEDFRYDTLSLTIDGRASGQMTVTLHIAGANPDFYDGYPVDFTLSVSGELAKAVQAGLSGYRVPDMIRERMESFKTHP